MTEGSSICWNCQRPWHDGPCSPANPFDQAHRAAEDDLERRAERLRQSLRSFLGWHLRGYLNGEWCVRGPKDVLVSAPTEATLLDKIRLKSGRKSLPVQGGFRW